VSNIDTQYANNAQTSITNNPLAIGDTTVTVLDVSVFPTITGAQYFYATLADIAGALTPEVVKVVSVDLGTNSMVVERGADGTVAVAWVANSDLGMRDNKGIFEELRDHTHSGEYSPEGHGHNANEIVYDNSTSGQAATDVQDAIDYNDEQIALRETAATGLAVGGELVQADPTHINVNAGSGEIVDGYTDRKEPVRASFTWPITSNILVDMPDTRGVQVFYLDSAGTVHQKADKLSDSEQRSFIQVGFVYYASGAITEIQTIQVLSNDVSHLLYDYVGYMDAGSRTKGLTVKSVTSAMSLWIESGSLFGPGINAQVDVKTPNVRQFIQLGDASTPILFDVLFEDGSVYLADQTVIPEFAETSPGVDNPLSGNNATIHYLFRLPGSKYALQLGQTEYASGAIARDAVAADRALFRPFVGSQITILSAQIYLDNNAPDFSNPARAGIVDLIGGIGNSGGSVVVNEYIQLTDVIDTTYVGNATKVPIVNGAETGLEFTTQEAIVGGRVRWKNTWVAGGSRRRVDHDCQRNYN